MLRRVGAVADFRSLMAFYKKHKPKIDKSFLKRIGKDFGSLSMHRLGDVADFGSLSVRRFGAIADFRSVDFKPN